MFRPKVTADESSSEEEEDAVEEEVEESEEEAEDIVEEQKEIKVKSKFKTIKEFDPNKDSRKQKPLNCEASKVSTITKPKDRQAAIDKLEKQLSFLKLHGEEIDHKKKNNSDNKMKAKKFKEREGAVIIPEAKKIGVAHLKTGPVTIYETPGKKYFYHSQSGIKNYVTDRVLSGKLAVELV